MKQLYLVAYSTDGPSTHTGAAHGSTSTIDVRSLPDGPYVIAAYSADGQRRSQRSINHTAR